MVKGNIGETDLSSPIPASSNSLDWDFDTPFTDQDLAEIDAIFESAISSSSASRIRIRHPNEYEIAEDGRKSRRRLPDSLFTKKDALENKSSLVRCPIHRLSEYEVNEATEGEKRSVQTNFPYSAANTVMRFSEMSFRGKIVYSRTALEVEKATDELLNLVNSKRNEIGQGVLGFDIEWKPTFKRGVPPGKAAVMQICCDKNTCHVMHIIHSGIPNNLKSLLMDPTLIKAGVCIANDAFKVLKDHNVSIEGVEDLSDLANQKLIADPKKWSLASLTETLIHKQLPKPGNIRMGNWEANVLSKKQLAYAATDAFASWFLYQALKSLPVPDGGCR